LRRRQIQRVDSGIDHTLALLRVFEKVITCERFTRLGRAVSFPWKTGDILCLVAMSSPRRKILLFLMQVKVGKEKRVVRDAPEGSGAIRWIIPHPFRTFVDYVVQCLQSGMVLGLEGCSNVHSLPPVVASRNAAIGANNSILLVQSQK
jgi:hypothetical protein